MAGKKNRTRPFNNQFLSTVKLEDGLKEEWYRDIKSSNWYLRLREKSKDFFFRANLGGRPVKKMLGSYPNVSEKEARELLIVCQQCVAKGIHPKDHFNALKNENLKASDSLFKFPSLLEDLITFNTTECIVDVLTTEDNLITEVKIIKDTIGRWYTSRCGELFTKKVSH